MRHSEPGEYAAAFLAGFFLYAMFEIAGRGYTHWTMGLTGGITLMLLYRMTVRPPGSIWVQSLLGALFVTCTEFTVGVIDNLVMGWHVWDYSAIRWNLLGQICPQFTLLWYVLCLAALCVCRMLAAGFSGSE